MPPAEGILNQIADFNNENNPIVRKLQESLQGQEVFRASFDTPLELIPQAEVERNVAANMYQSLVTKVLENDPHTDNPSFPVKIIGSGERTFSEGAIYAVMTEPDIKGEIDTPQMIVATDKAIYLVESSRIEGESGLAALTAFAHVHDDAEKLGAFLTTGELHSDMHFKINGEYGLKSAFISARKLTMTPGSGDRETYGILMNRLADAQVAENEQNREPIDTRF